MSPRFPPFVFQHRVGVNPNAPTTAPVLTLPTDVSTGVTTGDGTVTTNVGVGTLYFFVSITATPPSSVDIVDGTGATNFGNQTVAATGVQNVSATGLSGNTTYYIHYMHRDGASDSNISTADGFTTSAAPDTTAPILSSPTDANSGETTSTGTIVTDEGNGTLYWVVTTSATTPSKAQIKAGQDNSSVSATADGSQTVTSSGVENIASTGLTNNTAYTTHYMHEDAATNQSNAISASGFTTVASGSLSVVNQSADFGDLTASSAGLWTLVVAVGTVTSAVITAGDASSHWTIAANGDLSPSSAGDTANLNLGPYSLTCSYNSAEDTAVITVTIESGASCVSHTEIGTHITATSSSTDGVVLLRETDTIGTRAVVVTYTDAFDGTITDAARNTTGAKATYSGGSITFRGHANDSSNPKIDGVMKVSGGGPFYFDKIDFINASIEDASYNNQSPAGNNAHKQLHGQSNASVIANECNLGCTFYEAGNSARFAHAAYALNVAAWIFQGCTFDSVWHAITCEHSGVYILRDSTIRNQIHDSMRTMSNESGTGTVEFWWHHNVIYKAIKEDIWISDDFETSNNALHVDGGQIGANSDTNDYKAHIHHNYWYLIGYRSQGLFRGGNQGINFTGEITNNFIANTNSHGISMGAGSPLTIAHNTIISSINDSSQKFASTPHKIRSTQNDIIATNNIMGDLTATGSGSFTAVGNIPASHMDNTGGVEDYASVFDGPFDSFNEDFGKQFTVDETSRATVISSIDALFLPKTGGAAVGKGYQTEYVLDVTSPSLSDPVDTANGGTASTGSVSTNEDDGTLYWVVTTSSTAPTEAQVKLGQDNSSVAATASGNQSVSGTGTQNITPNGLTATTAYTTHFMHEDAAANQSFVSTASGFTTGAGFTAFAVDTNTSSDQFNSIKSTGAAVGTNDAQGMICFHYRPGTITTNARLFQLRDSGSTKMVDLFETTSGRLRIVMKNSSSTTVIDHISATSSFVNGTWYAIQIAWDISTSSPVFQWYVDDSQISYSGTPVLTGETNIGWAVAQKLGIFCESNGGNDSDLSLANFYIHDTTTLDMSSAGNRLKFSNTDTTQVNMGTDGSTPTGTQPLFFYDGALVGWATNKGSGPTGTNSGTLIAASSLPGV